MITYVVTIVEIILAAFTSWMMLYCLVYDDEKLQVYNFSYDLNVIIITSFVMSGGSIFLPHERLAIVVLIFCYLLYIFSSMRIIVLGGKHFLIGVLILMAVHNALIMISMFNIVSMIKVLIKSLGG